MIRAPNRSPIVLPPPRGLMPMPRRGLPHIEGPGPGPSGFDIGRPAKLDLGRPVRVDVGRPVVPSVGRPVQLDVGRPVVTTIGDAPVHTVLSLRAQAP